jgi:hypothetical protein
MTDTDQPSFEMRNARKLRPSPLTLHALCVSGKVADAQGARILQALADYRGKPIVVYGRTKYHENRVFWPRTSTLQIHTLPATA